jgi:hypothetical protein
MQRVEEMVEQVISKMKFIVIMHKVVLGNVEQTQAKQRKT